MPTKLWHAVVAERRPLRIASWCGTVEESPRSPQRDSIASAIPPLVLRPSSRFLSGFITKLATSTRITNHFTIPLTCIPLLFGKTCSRRRPSLAEISPYYRIHAKYIHLSSRVYTDVDYLHEFSPLKIVRRSRLDVYAAGHCMRAILWRLSKWLPSLYRFTYWFQAMPHKDSESSYLVNKSWRENSSAPKLYHLSILLV